MSPIHNFVQKLFASKGMYADWERLGNISAAIDVLQDVKENVTISLDTSYRGSTHKAPDTSALVWRVANKVAEHGLHKFQGGREGNDVVKLTPDLLAIGQQRLKSSTLATFNKKVRSLIDGEIIEDEVDELPTVEFGSTMEDES
jgi:Family of unknown function (DUF6589)